MYARLTVQERLKDLRVERNMTLEDLAEATGLSKSALGDYENNEDKDINGYAIKTLANFYGVSTDYLLAEIETKNHPNTELDALHLSDDMIDLLCSGHLNNRLLCEMALHPGFPQLMTDIEICVNRVADMRINQMNQVLEKAREMVMQRCGVESSDIDMRTLELAMVSEDMFYSHVIQKDMEAIIKDIRTAHESDSTTADAEEPSTAMVQEYTDAIQEIATLDAPNNEKRAMIAAKTLQIDYSSMSEEEKRVLERLSSRSPVFIDFFQRYKLGKPLNFSTSRPAGKHSKGKSKQRKR